MSGQGISELAGKVKQPYRRDTAQPDFGARMFRYFARLYEAHGLPVYPIALFSYSTPTRAEPEEHRVEFPHKTVLTFNYHVIQLNRLEWRDFLRQPNPVASALMARMRFAPEERPRVKLECLRLLANLRLDPAKNRLLSGFIDAYLRLDKQEQARLEQDMEEMAGREKEAVMEIVTSWKMEGLTEGLSLALTARFGEEGTRLAQRLPAATPEQLERLKARLLSAASVAELESIFE